MSHLTIPQTHDDLAKTVQWQLASRQRSHLAKRLASVLMAAHQIPAHDSALVPWLDHWQHATNQAALTEWVTQQLGAHGASTSHFPFHVWQSLLSQRLQRLLLSIQDGM